MALDFQGNVVTVIQIIALLLLVIGVYPYRVRTKNRNLVMHGFLSIVAFTINLATVFFVMIPTFVSGIDSFGEFTVLQAAIVWLHVGFGIAAIIMGLVIIISWVTHPLGELGCSKTWRWMMPTFAIWFLSLIFGIIIHFFDII
jgi:hypothetical protein